MWRYAAEHLRGHAYSTTQGSLAGVEKAKWLPIPQPHHTKTMMCVRPCNLTSWAHCHLRQSHFNYSARQNAWHVMPPEREAPCAHMPPSPVHRLQSAAVRRAVRFLMWVGGGPLSGAGQGPNGPPPHVFTGVLRKVRSLCSVACIPRDVGTRVPWSSHVSNMELQRVLCVRLVPCAFPACVSGAA